MDFAPIAMASHKIHAKANKEWIGDISLGFFRPHRKHKTPLQRDFP
jgi:hypothetical protein